MQSISDYTQSNYQIQQAVITNLQPIIRIACARLRKKLLLAPEILNTGERLSQPWSENCEEYRPV
jgi:hypothetical protein